MDNEKKLSIILDDCIARLKNGEAIEDVLAEYPDMRHQIEPLLRTAGQIYALPSISPSPEYIKTSEMHLIRLISAQSAVPEKAGGIFSRYFNMRNILEGSSLRRRLAVTVSTALVLVLLVITGQFIFFKPEPVMASTCFLRIMSGEVSIENIKSGSTRSAVDGMTIDIGTRVITGNTSHALITFFDGSTIKLSPGTSLDVESLEYGDDQSAIIVLKQWLGRTWSRVEKMVDPGTRYEIKTPSATAVVRGTLFTTEVDETGDTVVSTTEGLVSVAAEGEEVFVSPGSKTEVKTGKKPTQPEPVPGSETEIKIIIEGAVVGSISDPSGSSTGELPSGLSFNQIQGSTLTSNTTDTQIINLVNPANGNYTITLRYLARSTANYRIQYESNGIVTAEYSGSLATDAENGYIIRFNIKNGEETVIRNVKVKLLGDTTPEKAIEKESSSEKNTQGQDKKDKDSDTPQGQDKKDKDADAPQGQDKKDKDADAPQGQDKKDNDSETPQGQEKKGDDTTIPPGQDKKDDENIDPSVPSKDDDGKPVSPGQEKKDGDSETETSGDEKKDDSGETDSPGQDKQDNDTGVKPPGQDKKDNDSTLNQDEEDKNKDKKDKSGLDTEES